MTTLLFVLGVVLVAAAACLFLRAYVLPRLRFESHLRVVETYGYARRGGEIDAGVARRTFNTALNNAAAQLGAAVLRHIPRLKPVPKGVLTAAGYYELKPETVHGYRVAGALFLPALILLYAATTGGASLLTFALLIAAAIGGWELPALVIRHRARRRLDKIDHDLPQFIDLLVAIIEAGSAFGSALNGVADRFHGPLGDELQLTMRQQSLGIGTERALNDMAERCDTPSMRAFVRTVIRADSHGSSIGPVLRHLAREIRQRRRDAARERIQKAPIKMLFPLAFLILPALLLVILFPAMYNIIHTLNG
jgi:tight adherence protein C